MGIGGYGNYDDMYEIPLNTPPKPKVPAPVTPPVTPPVTQPTTPVTQPVVPVNQFAATQKPAVNKGGGAPAKQEGFYSPELEGLKHSYLSQDWNAGSPYADLFKGYMGDLATPIAGPVGMSPEEQQAQANMLRSNIMGSTKGMMDVMSDKMGAAGFRAGESGRADSALASVARGGQQEYSTAMTNMALEEAKRREALGLQTQELNMNRMLAAGKFGDLLETGDVNRLGLGLQAGQFAGGLEQYEKALEEQRRARAAAAGASGARFDWEKEKYKEQFGYQQERDATEDMFKYYYGTTDDQEDAYNRYFGAYD